MKDIADNDRLVTIGSDGMPLRAWAEINLGNLRHNLKVLSPFLAPGCQIMGIVKANAYGHGDIIIAKEMEKNGINILGVATVNEAIHLRNAGIRADILILGYTHPDAINDIVRYGLIQTVIDRSYGKQLNDYGHTVRVHLGLDTGMRRLGIDWDDHVTLKEMFSFSNLKIEGMFTHLSSSNMLDEESIVFTENQISRFFGCVDWLKANGYDPGKIHVQASYGLINYPYLPCHYARPGLVPFGILSEPRDETHKPVDLHPVLSLKARVACVKDIAEGDAVSYGRHYIASEKRKIAVLTIGYSDGVPRSLSNGKLDVLIKGKKAQGVGRICMDMLMVDVSDIIDVEPGDIATLIGSDGDATIHVMNWCSKVGTNSQEILSRLGNRLERIVVSR